MGTQDKDGEGISRRDVLKAGLGAAAAAGYAIAADPVFGQIVHTDAQGLIAGEIKFPSGGDIIAAYEARPGDSEKHPVVVVISEIFGLHEHIKGLCRRFAKRGYYAIAPEMFHREGGVAHLKDIQDILRIVNNMSRRQILQDLSAAADYARRQSYAGATRGVGVTGFCWGGSTTMQFAAQYQQLGAAVAWYGPPGRVYKDDPPKSGFDVAGAITAPFLGLFGELDTNPTPADVRRFEEMLKRRNRNVEIVIYTMRSEIWTTVQRKPHGPRGEFERGGGPPLSVRAWYSIELMGCESPGRGTLSARPSRAQGVRREAESEERRGKRPGRSPREPEVASGRGERPPSPRSLAHDQRDTASG